MNKHRLFSTGLLLCAFGIQPTLAAPKNLCFFSLNNAREYELTKAFLERSKSTVGATVNTMEFHGDGQNPEATFQAMVESQQYCDGLVISGHHTGSFGGRRAEGVLDISFLETLSCDARYEDFFNRVKGVWLQGCRTLGVGPLGAPVENSEELQADYHMQRVGAEAALDGLAQSFAELSLEFSATLDQDNPLASRYLRVFPAASVFGWTRSSPGERAGSEKSLLYHMAHMSRLTRGVEPFDPLRTNSPAVNAGMSESLWNLLQGNPADSEFAARAWLSHGRVKTPGTGFDNPDLNAYEPLLYSPLEKLLAAKALGCDLRNAADQDTTRQVLDHMLSDPDHVAYNLNVIWEVFRQSGKGDLEQQEALRRQLLGSDPLMDLLHRKLRAPESGLLMKIEYYSFYRDITGQSAPAVEAGIREQVRYFLLATDLVGSEYDVRDFRESLLLSLARHDLATTGFYLGLVHAPAVESGTLYTLTWSFLKESPPEAERILQAVVTHPLADAGTLRGAALWAMSRGSGDDAALLQTILASPDIDESTLASVASAVVNHNPPGSEQLIQDIVAHQGAGSLALSQASLAVRKHDLAIDRAVLQDIVAHPSVDKWGLQNAARAVAHDSELGDARFLSSIVYHDRVDANALSSVAIALGNDSFQGETELLDSIARHPQADERTLRFVDRAHARNRAPEAEEEFY
jgi:hypothetical protein